MAKSGKRKEGKQEEEGLDPSILKSSTSSSNSTVFAALFGSIPVDSSAASIFSDNNPFRRKPTESSENSDELKLQKRKKEGEDEGGDTEGLEEKKKSKRNVIQKQNVQFMAGNAIDEVKNENNMKKKRKRDEVEAEYESRRFGAVVEEEGGKLVGRKRKKMETEDDLLVEKEGFDDEDKLLRTVFVGNLPLKIKKKVLLKEFSKFGEVESVRIRSIPLKDSKIPRKAAVMKKQISDTADSVHAYVVFKTEESSQASLAHNMAVVGGNHIRVDRACPPRKKLKGDVTPLYDNSRTVFVGNIPFDVKDEELYQVFNRIKDLESSIEAIRIIRDPATSLGKGIAYVLFKTRVAANAAARKKNLKLRDRELRLSHAKANPNHPTTLKPTDSNQSKRKNPVRQEEDNSHSGKKIRRVNKFAGPEDKEKSNATMTYQGLRASKSGIQKKAHIRKMSERPNLDVKSQKTPKRKERQQKRPAVAARKAKELKGIEAGGKRKADYQTPDSFNRKTKARKLT